MRYVVTAEEMRALDAMTIHDIGLPGAVLMENAGRAVAQVVIQEVLDTLPEGSVQSNGQGGWPGIGQGGRPGNGQGGWPSIGQPRVVVVCGAGNNGGDGYVIARCLRAEGIDAMVLLAASETAIKGDARLHYDVYRKLGGPVVSIADASSLAELRGVIESADVVVDAIFGTGLGREVSGHYREVIEIINRGRGVRVSVDIPSGLSADTGQVLGAAVQADLTVTMAFLKVGLVSAPGFAHVGRVLVVDIGIAEELAEARGVKIGLMEPEDLAPYLPRRSPIDHKNRRGHLVAVAGSPGKRGAARLVTWAAMRAGAGLVTMASPWHGVEPVTPDPVMGVCLDMDDLDDAGATSRLLEIVRGKQALAIGPGMPTSKGAQKLVHAALAELDVPMVLDADALNHLGQDLGQVARAGAPVILTPHPGEAARLLGCTNAEIQEDRMAAVRRLAAESEAIVVLKGARTLICNGRGGDGQVLINPSGSGALATAGTGDVLTGVIGALLAQGVPPEAAACLGTYVHGRAGDLAAAKLGEMSVTAADLAEQLPAVLAELAEG